MIDDEAIEAGITDVTAAQAIAQGRPSWKKLELDAGKKYSDYPAQKSFKNGVT